MRIDPKIEQPTRTMLGHAIRDQLDLLADVIQAGGNKTFADSIPLCVLASAYIAINVAERWPTDADLREIAKNAAESGVTQLDISQQEIYEYLSRVALGSEPFDHVFSPEQQTLVPVAGSLGRSLAATTRFLLLREGCVYFHGTHDELAHTRDPYLRRFLA